MTSDWSNAALESTSHLFCRSHAATDNTISSVTVTATVTGADVTVAVTATITKAVTLVPSRVTTAGDT